jgi:hypothetical protein
MVEASLMQIKASDGGLGGAADSEDSERGPGIGGWAIGLRSRGELGEGCRAEGTTSEGGSRWGGKGGTLSC